MELTSTADEAENDLALVRQPASRLEQRVEGVTWAMIARIHYDEFLVKTVSPPKLLAADFIEPDVITVRPGRNDSDLLFGYTFGGDAPAHKPIEDNHFVRSL